MAEAFLTHYAPLEFEAMSAGLEPGLLNPHVVKVMAEKGIDISQKKTKGAFELYKQNMLFSHVITVCDREAAERCPLFPGVMTRLHWSFNDPSTFKGSQEDILTQVRVIRDQIEKKIMDFIHRSKNGLKFPEEEVVLTIKNNKI
jgi:arsenate reductase